MPKCRGRAKVDLALDLGFGGCKQLLFLRIIFGE